MRRRPLILVCLAILALGLLATGCGGGAKPPAVASLAPSSTGATTTTTEQSAPPAGGAAPSVGHGGQFQIQMKVGNAADGAKFSACMRRHGIGNFPDPNSQGVISMHSGMGFDPTSPSFRAARTTCAKLLPNDGQPTPAQLAQQQRQMLAFSACMRAHGIADFPDPSNGGIRLHSEPGSDLSPDNPTFQRAQQACQKDLPFKGGTSKAGGG